MTKGENVRIKSRGLYKNLLEQGIETERISPKSCIGNADYLDTKEEEDERDSV